MKNIKREYAEYREVGDQIQALGVRLANIKRIMMEKMGRKKSILIEGNVYLVKQKIHVQEHFVSEHEYYVLREKQM